MRWKNTSIDETGKNNYEPGIKVLNNVFRARVYIKRSGKEFEQFRRDLSNRYVSRSRKMSFDVIEVDRQIAYYKPVVNIYLRRKIDEWSQHLLSGKDLDKDNSIVEGSQHL